MHHFIIGKNTLTKSERVTCEQIAKRNDSAFEYIGRTLGTSSTYWFNTQNLGDSVTGPIVEAVKRELVGAGLTGIVLPKA